MLQIRISLFENSEDSAESDENLSKCNITELVTDGSNSNGSDECEIDDIDNSYKYRVCGANKSRRNNVNGNNNGNDNGNGNGNDKSSGKRDGNGNWNRNGDDVFNDINFLNSTMSSCKRKFIPI